MLLEMYVSIWTTTTTTGCCQIPGFSRSFETISVGTNKYKVSCPCTTIQQYLHICIVSYHTVTIVHLSTNVLLCIHGNTATNRCNFFVSEPMALLLLTLKTLIVWRSNGYIFIISNDACDADGLLLPPDFKESFTSRRNKDRF